MRWLLIVIGVGVVGGRRGGLSGVFRVRMGG